MKPLFSAILLLSVVAASCGSAEPFGNASITPRVTPTGFLVTLEPSAAVDLICGEPASIHSASNRPKLLGLVGVGEAGAWIPDGPDGITVPACLPAPTSLPATYRVPDELVPGDYILCRGFTRQAEGCATFTVVPLADSDNPDAVPLTTLSPEIPVFTNPPERE